MTAAGQALYEYEFLPARIRAAGREARFVARPWELSEGGAFSRSRWNLWIVLAQPEPELALNAPSSQLLPEPVLPAPPENWEGSPTAALIEREPGPPATRLRLGWMEAGLGLEGQKPTLSSTLTHGGLQATATAGLGSWRRYELHYSIRITEGLTFAAGATRRVQPDAVENSGEGSLRWSF